MTATEKMEHLFAEWENTVDGHNGRFVKDCIINEKAWEQINPKILFVAKEANQSGNQQPGDFRNDWITETKDYPFKCRIAEWSYGIINNFPSFDSIANTVADHREMLNRIAFLNIKKTGGGGTQSEELGNHFNKNLSFLKRQIEIISPDIIILALSFTKNFNAGLFDEMVWKGSGYGINVGKWKNAKLIDFYHPSSRNTPNAAYSLLQNVVYSDVFKSL